nr:UDP-N-acetylmuramate dehydrogenase [Pollutimonas nitritireducens]
MEISGFDLLSSNTLGLPAHAAAMTRYRSTSQLRALSEICRAYPRAFVLGGGSNVVMERDLESLVIKVESAGVSVHSETNDELIIEAHAGENWHKFVSGCVGRGWNGLENLALIPGTVGAAPVQNIGAYGVELDQRFHSLVAWDMLDARLVDMDAADCQFSYRNSFFKQAKPGRWLILKVRFKLPRRWHAVLDYPDLRRHPVLEKAAASVTPKQIFDAVCEIRREKLPDPTLLGNAGSFFKNPIVTLAQYESLKSMVAGVVAYPQDGGLYKLAAGWLIDRAGWKGRRVGSVGVHERQALVLVNYGGATAQDIKRLAKLIQDDVMSRFGVLLEQEPVPVS